MAATKHLFKELGTLTEKELQEVKAYVAFLKFRSRLSPMPDLGEAQLAKLYAEFSDEDRSLAEEGMQNYGRSLSKEDLT